MIKEAFRWYVSQSDFQFRRYVGCMFNIGGSSLRLLRFISLRYIFKSLGGKDFMFPCKLKQKVNVLYKNIKSRIKP